MSRPLEIAVIGSHCHPHTTGLIWVIFNIWIPCKVLAASDPDDPEPETGLALLENKTLINGHPAAYVCRNHTCRLPFTEADLLKMELAEA